MTNSKFFEMTSKYGELINECEDAIDLRKKFLKAYGWELCLEFSDLFYQKTYSKLYRKVKTALSSINYGESIEPDLIHEFSLRIMIAGEQVFESVMYNNGGVAYILSNLLKSDTCESYPLNRKYTEFSVYPADILKVKKEYVLYQIKYFIHRLEPVQPNSGLSSLGVKEFKVNKSRLMQYLLNVFIKPQESVKEDKSKMLELSRYFATLHFDTSLLEYCIESYLS